MNIMKRNKIVFSVLKELAYNGYNPKSEDYSILEDDYVDILRYMVEEGYLNSNRIVFNILGTAEVEMSMDLVTQKGENYLIENEAWNRLYSSIADYKKL